MNQKAMRVVKSVLLAIVCVCVGIYFTVSTNDLGYREHPVAALIGTVIPGILAGCGLFLWDRRKAIRPVIADRFYDQVAGELQSEPVIPGLWTKAYAEAGGEDAKARALYIRYRAAQLAEASRDQWKAAQWKAKPFWREARTGTQVISALLCLIFGAVGLGLLLAACAHDSDDPSFYGSWGAILLAVAGYFAYVATRSNNKTK
jgi:hypothetical protein